MEGLDFKGMNDAPKPKEASTDVEKVKDALEHLGDQGTAARDALYEIGIDGDEFRARVRIFNNLSAEERGAGRYDHGQSLEERAEAKTIEQEVQIGVHGHVTALLDPDGSILLSVSPHS